MRRENRHCYFLFSIQYRAVAIESRIVFSYIYFCPVALFLLLSSDLKRLHDLYFFFFLDIYLFFSRLCAFTVLGPFEKFRHVRVKVDDSFWMRQSYMRWHANSSSSTAHRSSTQKISVRFFFYFPSVCILLFHREICNFFSFFPLYLTLMFDNGATNTPGISTFAIGQDTRHYSINLLLCMQSRLFIFFFYHHGCVCILERHM